MQFIESFKYPAAPGKSIDYYPLQNVLFHFTPNELVEALINKYIGKPNPDIF